MFKGQDTVYHPRLGYGEVINVKIKKLKNYEEEITYEIYFNGKIRKIRDTSIDYKDIKLVERSL